MTPARPVGQGSAGFTLLELLVAMSVLGLVLALLSQGVQFGVRATQAQSAFRERHADLEVADRTLRRLVALAYPGAYPEPPGFRGTAATLAFTTELPAAALGRGLADVALGVEAGRLVLRWTPRLHQDALGPPPVPYATPILDGVERVVFSYSGGGPWQDAWRAERLPQLVRIQVVFAASSGRHWPPVVAAPLREATEQ